MKNVIVIISLLAAFLSCNTTKPVTPPVSSDSLPATVVNSSPGHQPNPLDSAWELQNQFGSQQTLKNIPLLVINSSEKKFSGSTGCNRMSGTFMFDQDKIKFNEQIMTTKMACDGYNENDFINTLLKVNTYRVQDSTLELSLNDIVLLTFKKK